jgi:hypothetical protein
MGAFMDLLCSKPMGDAAVGEKGARWRAAMAVKSKGSRIPPRKRNTRQVRRARSAAKRKVRDRARAAANLAQLAAAVNKALGW